MSDIEPRTVTHWDGRRGFKHGRALSAAERARVALVADELDAALGRPLTEETVPPFVKRLVASLRQKEETFSAPDLVAGLVLALHGRCDAAFAEAIRQILAGEAAGFSLKFMPGTPEIADLVRRIEARWEFQRQALRKLLALKEEPPTEPEHQPTAEHMAAVREKVRKLTADAAARRAMNGRPGAAATKGGEA